MDFTFLAQLSKPMSALVGGLTAGLVAVVLGSVMLVVLKHSSFARNTDAARAISSKVSMPVFYYGIVAPVWAIIGAVFGYQLGGQG